MDTTQRKTMLYKTGVEYGDYTMNHVLGCSHGCKYPCYAFMMKKRFGVINSYEQWCQPVLVSNTLELLEKEIPRLKDKINMVQLCFSTDPFMFNYPEVGTMSINAIKKLNAASIPCSILTKGILPKELKELSSENLYGITLVSLSEEFRKKYEPGSAPIDKRLSALKVLHEAGCKTWISIEPYPTPNIIEQDLNAILESIVFADKIIFGRTNYSKMASSYKNHHDFYNKTAEDVIAFCSKHNIDYHIKKGTISDS